MTIPAKNLALSGSLLLSLTAQASAAGQPAAPDQTMIEIAGHQVPVTAGGLYQRFRSNPPLSVIAAEAPELDLSWFRQLKKEKVDIGFESYSPNFYYKNSKITAIYTADLDRLRELIPVGLRQLVQPLQVWPGRAAVALTAYSYQYCDNDSYNEVSLAVITNRPGQVSFGPLSLIGQAASGDFWAYVLKLPVNTELARVRGVVGYQLPKWLTSIVLSQNEQSISFSIGDAETGETDLVLSGKKLADVSDQPQMIRQSFSNLDLHDQPTYGYTLARQLKHATSSDADSVRLKLGEGSFSSFLKSLKLGKLIKYEYVPEFQAALYAPSPLSQLDAHD